MGAANAGRVGLSMGMDRDSAKVSTQVISVVQVNLNKAHAAHVELLNKINKMETYIALITEPFCYKKKLCICLLYTSPSPRD